MIRSRKINNRKEISGCRCCCSQFECERNSSQSVFSVLQLRRVHVRIIVSPFARLPNTHQSPSPVHRSMQSCTRWIELLSEEKEIETKAMNDEISKSCERDANATALALLLLFRSRRCLCLQPPVMVVIVIIMFSHSGYSFRAVKSLKFATAKNCFTSSSFRFVSFLSFSFGFFSVFAAHRRLPNELWRC